jgi:hypothetical protein
MSREPSKCSRADAGRGPAHDYSDLWWNAAEPGWGLNLIQHASNVVSACLYTYDDNGKPHGS